MTLAIIHAIISTLLCRTCIPNTMLLLSLGLPVVAHEIEEWEN